LIKVLIIDDSAMVRKIITQELSKDPDIKVVGTAPDPYIGRNKIVSLKPDVLILDIEMPKMDGLTFLDKLMRAFPMPVIILSSLAKEGSSVALKAYDLGALEVICKPGLSYSVEDMGEQIRDKVKAVNEVKRFKKNIFKENKVEKPVKKTHSMLKTTNKIIAIGASTGGTEAIYNLLTKLPSDIPPILIVQHMPQYFTKTFADRLNNYCQFEVKEAVDGERIYPGKALLAPGNMHMALRRSGANYYVKIFDGPLKFHQRPSVEVLFDSVAEYAGRNSIGVLLTGMGKDGAQGLLNMKNSGAFTIVQNEESCVVFGMPKEAISLGAATKVLHINKIHNAILGLDP